MRKRPPAKTGKAGPSDIKSVMFVSYTAHSELASRLRESEEQLKQMTGYRIKIVEKVGNKLVDLLHKSDPWAGDNCGRERCLLCETKVKENKVNTQDCHKRNCVPDILQNVYRKTRQEDRGEVQRDGREED